MLVLLLAVSFQCKMRDPQGLFLIRTSSRVHRYTPSTQSSQCLDFSAPHCARTPSSCRRKAETLQATTTKLKDDACKAPLITKISHSSSRDGPREVNPPSSFRNQPAATRAAGPTTDEWFDPGTNKKKRDSRLNAASATPAAAFSPTPLRRSRSKAAEGTSKAPTQGLAFSVKKTVKNSAKGSTNLPSSTTSTVPTKGRALAAKPSVTSDPSAKTAKQRAQAVDELDYLIDVDRKSFTTDQATNKVALPATNAKLSKVTALEVS